MYHIFFFSTHFFHFCVISYIHFLINRFLGCCFPHCLWHCWVVQKVQCCEKLMMTSHSYRRENPHILDCSGSTSDGRWCSSPTSVVQNQLICSHTSEMWAKKMELQARKSPCVGMCMYVCEGGCLWKCVYVCVWGIGCGCVCLGGCVFGEFDVERCDCVCVCVLSWNF